MTADTNFDTQKFLEQFKGQLTPDREAIVAKLVERPWFQKSDPALQKELVTLPQEGMENHDGYLSDLAERPDHIGGIDVLSLHSLARGFFALISRFNVRNSTSGTEYTYEYVSWRYGSLPGAKGIVFVRTAKGEAPTHFIVLVGEKFAPGKKVYDTIGGFIDLGVEGVQTLADRVLLEIKQEMGLSDLQVDEVIDLGQVYTDPGMSNSKPGSFAAFITSDQAGRIPAEQTNDDIYELKSGAQILPLAELRHFCNSNTDALFFAALVKTIASDKTDAATQQAILDALAAK